VKRAWLAALLLMFAPALASADPARNEAVARSIIEQVLSEGRLEIVRQVFDPAYVFHGDGRDYALSEVEASMRDLRAAFPDLRMQVDRAVAMGDWVAIHWSGAGANSPPRAAFRVRGGA
jgi:predicted SnoaL-like aldol condensation-catalyzing enzyme